MKVVSWDKQKVLEVKENSIKNERSSIKEAIKTMEHWVEYEKNNKDRIKQYYERKVEG